MGDAVTSVSPEHEPGPDDRSPDLAPLFAVVRQRVALHVRQRRGEGAPLERVVPELRCLVREAQSSEGWHDPTDVLMAVVVGWAVETYYDDQPELRHVPRFY